MCGEIKPFDEFHKHKNKKDGRGSYCKTCSKKYREIHKEELKEYKRKYRQENKERLFTTNKEWYERVGREQRGSVSMYENKTCAQYLGIVIGERLCRHLFKDIEVMPNGNTGYDIICNKGKKIDVKTACITLDRASLHWQFRIDYNITADFFILVAFDNLTDLNPLHMWMIPGEEINHRASIQMYPSTIYKWDKWKRDINDAQICCAELKNYSLK